MKFKPFTILIILLFCCISCLFFISNYEIKNNDFFSGKISPIKFIYNNFYENFEINENEIDFSGIEKIDFYLTNVDFEKITEIKNNNSQLSTKVYLKTNATSKFIKVKLNLKDIFFKSNEMYVVELPLDKQLLNSNKVCFIKNPNINELDSILASYFFSKYNFLTINLKYFNIFINKKYKGCFLGIPYPDETFLRNLKKLPGDVYVKNLYSGEYYKTAFNNSIAKKDYRYIDNYLKNIEDYAEEYFNLEEFAQYYAVRTLFSTNQNFNIEPALYLENSSGKLCPIAFYPLSYSSEKFDYNYYKKGDMIFNELIKNSKFKNLYLTKFLYIIESFKKEKIKSNFLSMKFVEVLKQQLANNNSKYFINNKK